MEIIITIISFLQMNKEMDEEIDKEYLEEQVYGPAVHRAIEDDDIDKLKEQLRGLLNLWKSTWWTRRR